MTRLLVVGPIPSIPLCLKIPRLMTLFGLQRPGLADVVVGWGEDAMLLFVGSIGVPGVVGWLQLELKLSSFELELHLLQSDEVSFWFVQLELKF